MRRRAFLGQLGAALAASGGIAARAQHPSLEGRVGQSYELRLAAARAELGAAGEPSSANRDESDLAGFCGNYSKGLPHDAAGNVEPSAYRALARGLRAADAGDRGAELERVGLGGNQMLVNPLAGVAFDLEGRDPGKLAAPPTPRFSSAQRAAEAIELYWMALCRDTAFAEYSADRTAAAAAAELGTSAGRLFRGFAAGDAVGPYVSQLFLTPFAYGQYVLDGRITVFVPGLDYLQGPAAWLACENGSGPFPPPAFDPTPRYFRCGRDLASYVHSDQACQAFYNAGLRLLAFNAPANPGNPYLQLEKQSSFATFGAPHFLTLQAEAAWRAVKAVFRQKWFVHRTLRPEEFGGRLQVIATGAGEYPVHKSMFSSEALARSAARFGSALLPQAFPEGCPQHPSYTQAHGGVAGACATILKAAFDGATPWSALGDGSLKLASGDGLALEEYSGADAGQITVNGEIEKLASNIALARNFAGVHTCTSGALILAFLAGPAIAQVKPQSPATDAQAILAPIFSGFRSPKWDQRANAFRALLRLGSNETEFAPRPLHLALARFGHEANQIHLALIALLAREDDAANNAPRGYWSPSIWDSPTCGEPGWNSSEDGRRETPAWAARRRKPAGSGRALSVGREGGNGGSILGRKATLNESARRNSTAGLRLRRLAAPQRQDPLLRLGPHRNQNACSMLRGRGWQPRALAHSRRDLQI
ncbi:MAG TPA: hypothetical protein VN690_09865 [Terriglobales bacterium]|nr:hypothetical protein [Terriglobales bacterium]